MRIIGGPRKYVQWTVFLITLEIGLQFTIYVNQASQIGPIGVSRPPGVEGFLPIGALMVWKAFLSTGIWDTVHPAAMVILGFAALISILFRKSFCAWFCSVGTLSECLWHLGQRAFGKNYRLPAWLYYSLRSLKYIHLGFFLWFILAMDSTATVDFLQSPYYKMADAKMLFFFTHMSKPTGIVLVALIIASCFVRNPWCRYLCPYGALMGLLACMSPTSLKRDSKTCIECKRCTKICPYHLSMHTKTRIKSPECNGCMECTLACPVEATSQCKTQGLWKHAWSPIRMGAMIGGIFVFLVFTARITGHWRSSVTDHEFGIRLRVMDSPLYMHPATVPPYPSPGKPSKSVGMGKGTTGSGTGP